MTKINRAKKQPVSAEQSVRDWLTKTGFPLEMSAANAFRSAGFEVTQSSTYLDPQIDDKSRDIDILATDPDVFGPISIHVVVECKATPKPWVVLTSPDAYENYNAMRLFALMSNNALEALLSRWRAGRGLTGFQHIAPYLTVRRNGEYGFRQAHSGEKDPAYGATIDVLKAGHSLIRAAQQNKYETLTIVFPVIVVETPIFECQLADTGQLQLIEVQESGFLFSTYAPELIGSRVRVVRETGLAEFAISMKKLADALRSELKSEEDRIFRLLSNENNS